MDKSLMRAQVGRCIAHGGDGYQYGAVSFSAIAEEVTIEDLQGVDGGLDTGVRLHVAALSTLPKPNDVITRADGRDLRVVRVERAHGHLRLRILCTPMD